MSVKIGISPIAWQNDDLPDLTAGFTMEQALRESYHAADATPVSADVLAGLSPDAFMAARLRLTPAADSCGWLLWLTCSRLRLTCS